MHGFMLLLFSLAGGLTLSGITANLYRMLARKPQSTAETAAYYGVMVVAGPSVLFENSTRSFRQKECTRIAYGFALVLACYWAFLLGLAVISLDYVLK
jgi:hypothetical protein